MLLYNHFYILSTCTLSAGAITFTTLGSIRHTSISSFGSLTRLLLQCFCLFFWESGSVTTIIYKCVFYCVVLGQQPALFELDQHVSCARHLGSTLFAKWCSQHHTAHEFPSCPQHVATKISLKCEKGKTEFRYRNLSNTLSPPKHHNTL